MLTLRDYRSSDLDAMYALDAACFEPIFRFSRRAMQRFAEAQGALALIAEMDTQFAGFAIVQMERTGPELFGYVVTLDVDPQWRRAGVAAALMAEMEAKAAAQGAAALQLHVFVGNEAAIRLYERLGYERAGSSAAFYGREGLDAAIYRKRLWGTSKHLNHW